MNFTIALGLLFTWVASVIGGIALFTKSMPGFEAAHKELPQTRLVERTETVIPFTTLDLKGVAIVELIEGPTTSVRLHGPEQVMNNMSATTTGGALQLVYVEDKTSCIIFCPGQKGLTATITAPNITTIKAKDRVRINAEKLSTPELTLELSDISRIVATVSSTKLSTSLGDASRLELSGKTEILEAKLSDMSRLEATDLQTNTSTISVTDAGRAYVTVTQLLNATARDAGRIYYAGTPVIEKNTRDGARVSPMEMEFRD